MTLATDDQRELDYFSVQSACNCTHSFKSETVFWAAILRRAVTDYVSYSCDMNEKKFELAQSAERWIFGEGTSFEDVCAILDLDPDSVRKRLHDLVGEGECSLIGIRSGS